jgi:hypothetical protein
MICLLLVAALVSSSVGYASANQASTYNEGNAADVNAFTVDIVNSAGAHVESPFVDEVSYTVSDDGYVIADATHPVIITNTGNFIKSTAISAHDGYEIAAIWTMSIEGTGCVLVNDSDHRPTMNVSINDAGDAGVDTNFDAAYGVKSGYYAISNPETSSLELTLTISDVLITDGMPTAIKMSVSFMLKSVSSGAYSLSECEISMGGTVAAVANAIRESLVVATGTGTYGVSVSDNNIVVQRTDSGNQLQMDLSFDVPQNTAFAIEILIKDAKANLVATLKDGETTIHTATLANSNNNDSRHFIYSGCGNVGGDTNAIRDDDGNFDTDIKPGMGNSSWFTGTSKIHLTFDSVASGQGNDKIGNGSQIIIHLKNI